MGRDGACPSHEWSVRSAGRDALGRTLLLPALSNPEWVEDQGRHSPGAGAQPQETRFLPLGSRPCPTLVAPSGASRLGKCRLVRDAELPAAILSQSVAWGPSTGRGWRGH